MSASAKQIREVLDTFVETMNAAGNPGAERQVQGGGHRFVFLVGQVQGKRRMPERSWNLYGTTITESGALLEQRGWEMGTGRTKPPPPDLFRTPYREAIIAHRSAIALEHICRGVKKCLLENLVKWPPDGPSLEAKTRELNHPTLNARELDKMLRTFFDAIGEAGDPGAAPIRCRDLRTRKPGWWIAEVGTVRSGRAPVFLTTNEGVVTRASGTGPVREFPRDFAVDALASFRGELVHPETEFDQAIRVGMLHTLGRHEVPLPKEASSISPHLVVES